ncbi:MAG: SUF system NifU family Fe-S cluster assembly protein [Chloroflexi bacterium]|nr:SUF system NifU family Fe-S cluster assembly protein [Chloroflexota bacterium]
MALGRIDDLYRDAILDHRRNPRNHEPLSSPDIVGEAINPFCGDEIHLQMNIDADRRVIAVGLQGEGCSIVIAAGSILAEAVQGKDFDEIDTLVALYRKMMQGDTEAEEALFHEGDLANLAGVRDYPIRIKCALLPLSALTQAMQSYRSSVSIKG